MKQILFYPNREDKPDSCMLACIRSALEYWTGNSCSWEYMEDLLGYTPGKAAWSVGVWTKLAKQGFDIRMIERLITGAMPKKASKQVYANQLTSMVSCSLVSEIMPVSYHLC